MKNMENKSYTNNAGRKVLEYLSSDTIVLDLPFIMTQDKFLIKKLPYLKLEKRSSGDDIVAIRLLDFHDYEGVVYLNVQELQTDRVYNLSWNMEFDGDWWFWSLSDYDTLMDIKGADV